MDDIYLKLNKERNGRSFDLGQFCEDHSSSKTKPRIQVTDALQNSSGYLNEKILLRPTQLGLTFSDIKQSHYTAILNIQLTQEIPASLLNVQTQVIVEGARFEEVYEAESYLNTTFQWDGLNVYGNKHYGQAYVRIQVGYNYKMCHQTVWETLKVKVHGHSPVSTDLGGWNLDNHHFYNSHDAIVYKGDGQIIDPEKHEKIVKVLNENLSKTIISPVALHIMNDDSIIVGDQKFIRHIDFNGKVTNVLKLNESTTNHKYYLTVTVGRTNYIIMSDPINKRILKIPTHLPSDKTLSNNYDVIVGSDQQCNSFERDCNEGDDPLSVNLIYPKGLSITTENELVFIDGSLIRIYTVQGKLVTLAGLNKAATDWKPSSCGSDLNASEASFKWPTDLAVNPSNGDIAIIDQGSMYLLTKQGRVKEVISSNCPLDKLSLNYPPKSVAYSHNGELILADENNIIHKMDSNGKFSEVAGSMSYCKRSTYGCLQSDFDEAVTVGSKARFLSISSISVNSEGTILVTDTDKHHIRSISIHKPQQNEITKTYEVMSPDTEEIYQFDQNGKHLSTRGLYISTGGGLDFVYNGDKLSAIHDQDNNKLVIERKDKLINLKLSQGLTFKLKLNKINQLEQAILPSGYVVMYRYRNGAISRKFINRKLHNIFEYDKVGLVEQIHGLCQRRPSSEVPGRQHKVVEEQSYLLEELYDYESKFNLLKTGVELQVNNLTVHKVKWNHFIHSSRTRSSFSLNVDGIGKKLEVNGEIAFTSELHPRSMIRSLYDSQGIQMLKVEEYGVPKRTIFFPFKNSFSAVDETFNDKGRLTLWKRGDMNRTLTYDTFGRISSLSHCQTREEFQYLYSEGLYPQQRNEYQVELDNSGGLVYVMSPSGDRHQFNFRPMIGEFILSYLPPWTDTEFNFKVDSYGKVLSTKQDSIEPVNTFENDTTSTISCNNLRIEEGISNLKILRKYQHNSYKVEENTFITTKSQITDRQIFKKDQIISNSSFLCAFSNLNSSLNCGINIDIHKRSLNLKFNKLNMKIEKFGNFEKVNSGQSYAWVNNLKNIVLKFELNSFGKTARKEITVKNQIVYTTAFDYNCLGQVERISESSKNSRSKVKEISYNSRGLMEKVEGDYIWSYSYDINSNIQKVEFSAGSIEYDYEAGERIIGIKDREPSIQYSTNGAMVKRDGYKFVYNCNNQLVQILHNDIVRKEIIYDAIGRPVLIFNPVHESNLTLIYNQQEQRIWEVLFWKDQGDIVTSIYDNAGQMLAFEKGEETFTVVTDNMKTPYLVLDEDGEVAKERTYSPFGALVDDSREDLLVPIGFHGGLDLDEAGVVLIEGRPYDTLLGQWMVPDINSILQYPDQTDVTSIHLYRFKNNDPMNTLDFRYMDTLEEWLTFFDYDLKTIQTSTLHSHIFKGLKLPTLTMEDTQDVDIFDPNVQRNLQLDKERRRVPIARSFHMSSPIFPNVILTKNNDKISSLPVEGANPVEVKMAKLMDNSILLENYGHDHDTIYFVKTDNFEEEEVENLKRYLKIEERTIPPFGKEICFNTSVRLCGLSGVEAIEGDQLKQNMGQIVQENLENQKN